MNHAADRPRPGEPEAPGTSLGEASSERSVEIL